MNKERFKRKIRNALSKEPEIQRIVLFGSFLHSKNPHDIDIAVFQNSKQGYFTLSMKYRKLLRDVAKKFPIDIFPVTSGTTGTFLEEISNGEIIYER